MFNFSKIKITPQQANEKLEAQLRQQAAELSKTQEALERETAERVRAERTLRESEQYNRHLFEISPIGLALCRMDGSLVDINPAYANILGRTVVETLTLTYWDITPPRYAAQEAAQLESLKKTGRYGPYEKEYIHKDGHLVSVRLSGLMMEKDGESFIWSSVEDITDRKAAEEEIFRAQTFLDSIIENIPDMIFVKEARELRFVRFNRAGEKLLGYSRETLIGKNDYDFFPQAEADFFTAKDHEVLANRNVLDIPEEVIHTKNGERLLHTKKVPLYDDKGVPRYLLGISEDITEKRLVQQALLQHTEQLARSKVELEQLEIFAFVATHDLQEPLRKIIFFSDILLLKAARLLDEENRGYLEKIKAGTLRMSQMISDLREFSRIDSAGQQFQEIHLKEVIHETLPDLELLIQESGGEIDIGEMPVIRADRLQMRQLFQNLIGNALKFRRSGVNPQVLIQSRVSESGQLEIIVRDNGIGFDEKYLDRIFKPFQRLHGMAEYPGSGIGLAICQKIVVRHGGKITAKSIPGQGTHFIITLNA